MPSQSYFNQFWSAYPKKVAKAAAERAFQKLKPNTALLNNILTGIEAWKGTRSWQDDGGRYIPYPATFLNGRRWEDEIPAEAPRREMQVDRFISNN